MTEKKLWKRKIRELEPYDGGECYHPDAVSLQEVRNWAGAVIHKYEKAITRRREELKDVSVWLGKHKRIQKRIERHQAVVDFLKRRFD